MALALDGSAGAGDYLRRSSGIVNHNSAYAVTLWYRLNTDLNTYGHIWAANADSTTDTSGDYVNADYIALGSDGTTIGVYAYNGGSGSGADGSSLSVGTWYHLAIVRESSSILKLYVDGALAATSTQSISGRASTVAEFIGRLHQNYPTTCRVMAVKRWQTSLTIGQVQAEMRSIRPQNHTSLIGWSPMNDLDETNALRDLVAGTSWVEDGILAIEDNPPVSFGSPALVSDNPGGAVAYSLTAAQGSYALTGQATAVRAARRLAAAQGSYTLTGQATGLKRQYTLVAAQGSYALTGQATGLKRQYTLVAAQGSYALTGQAEAFKAARRIVADQGSYALTGRDVTLVYGAGAKILTAGQGSYTLTGQAAAIRADRRLTAVQGSYTLAGQDAALKIARQLVAAQGSYALSGQAAGLTATRRVTISAGGYALTGQSAGLLTARKLAAGQGSYSLTGIATGLIYSAAGRVLVCETGSYTLTGFDVIFNEIVPVFPDVSPQHYTVTPAGARLGPAIDNVNEPRLGAASNNPASRRLGARNR